MVNLQDVQTHMQERSPVPRIVYGIVLILALVLIIFFGYYVWTGVQEANKVQEISTQSRMSSEDASKIRAQVMEGSSGAMQNQNRQKMEDELVGKDGRMSETDAAQLRAQLTQ